MQLGKLRFCARFWKHLADTKTNHKDMLATWEYYQEKMFDVYLQIPTYDEIQLRILERNSIRKYQTVVLGWYLNWWILLYIRIIFSIHSILLAMYKIILRQPEISYNPLDIRQSYIYCESGCFYFSYAIFLEWYFIYHYYERDAIKSLYTLFYGANFHINEDRTESSN